MGIGRLKYFLRTSKKKSRAFSEDVKCYVPNAGRNAQQLCLVNVSLINACN